MIDVRQESDGDPLVFTVVVSAGKGETRHRVTMARKIFDQLSGGKRAPMEVIEAAFRFLLDREPKESILSRFDVSVISRYFPDFMSELPGYLDKQA